MRITCQNGRVARRAVNEISPARAPTDSRAARASIYTAALHLEYACEAEAPLAKSLLSGVIDRRYRKTPSYAAFVVQSNSWRRDECCIYNCTRVDAKTIIVRDLQNANTLFSFSSVASLLVRGLSLSLRDRKSRRRNWEEERGIEQVSSFLSSIELYT